jgi:phage-related protein
VTRHESGWPVVYYRAADGSEPVDAFIDSLEPKVQVVLDNQIDRIPPFGPLLPFLHSSQVEGELRELRCHYGSTLFRILYWRSDNLLVLLHALDKRTGRIPEADKRIRASAGATSSDGWTKRRGAHRAPPVMTHPSLLTYQKW